MGGNDDVNVSDHAVIRFLERVGGIDMDYFRRHIASLVTEAMDAGATSITIDGFVYTLNPKERRVCTILSPQMRANTKKRYHSLRKALEAAE